MKTLTSILIAALTCAASAGSARADDTPSLHPERATARSARHQSGHPNSLDQAVGHADILDGDDVTIQLDVSLAP